MLLKFSIATEVGDSFPLWKFPRVTMWFGGCGGLGKGLDLILGAFSNLNDSVLTKSFYNSTESHKSQNH